jgi:periplasmic copper chaperone A
MTTPSTRALLRALALPAAGAAVLLTAGPAAAHVTISPTEGAAGSSTVLTASVPHGCDGSPTTKVAIQMPEQILSVTPTRNPLWEVRKVMATLDEPITDSHGNEITERVAQVEYTANDPLPEGYRDAFELSLQLPDAAGETLAFPVVQTCEEGETAWVETAADGDTEELAAPAPTVTLLPAEGDAQGTTEDAGSTTSDEAAGEVTESGAGDDGSNTLSVVALVAGLLGLAAGVGALVTARRRS